MCICICLFRSLILLLFFHCCFYVFNSVFLFACLFFPLLFLEIVIHGKYHNFRVLFLYFCVCSSYLFINLLLFFFFYFLMELIDLEEYGLAVSLSLFEVVVCSFYKLCLYQLGLQIKLIFIHFFRILLYIIFNYLQIFLYKRQGSLDATLEEFFILKYLIFCRFQSSLIDVVFPEPCLLHFKVVVSTPE